MEGTMTTTQTVFTQVIKRDEYHDADVMNAILTDTMSFGKRDLGNLGRYKKGRVHGNRVETEYSFAKDCEKYQLGRLYVKGGLGLQGFPFDIRNPLLEKHYWDVDMENAHYILLERLASDWGLERESIKHYINNRSEELLKVSEDRSIAKTAFLKVAYGGNIKLHNEYCEDGIAPDGDKTLLFKIEKEMQNIVEHCWLKHPQYHKIVSKKPNPKFSLFALILQTEERKCLLAMMDYFATQNRYIGVLVHDGGALQKLKNETEFPSDLLPKCEEYILEKTGYKHRIIHKPYKHKFVMKTDGLLDSNIIVSDTFAAKEFAKIMGKNLVLDTGVVWAFDNTTGLWSCDPATIRRLITNCGLKLCWKQMGTLTVKTYDYAGSVRNTQNLLTKLPDVLPAQNGYFEERIASDVGKLLFLDGIFDFKTAEFTPRFDSSIIFRHSMPRKFPKRDTAKIQELHKIVFDEAFAEIDNANTLKHSLMRAAIGDYHRRVMIVGLGFTASGKGALQTLIKTAFGAYCDTFDANSLVGKSYDLESSREMGWVLGIASRRFALSSEIKTRQDDGKRMKIAIDGNMLKRVVSGGTDPIKARKLHENDTTVMNKATMFMFAQELPNIDPPDDAVMNRLRVVNWSYSYVDEPSKPYEKKRDVNILHKFSDPEFGDAFFWLMVDEYEDWRKKNFEEPVRPQIELDARDEIAQEVDVTAVLLEKYEITKNPNDKVLFQEIEDYLKECGVVESNQKLGRLLGGLGLGRETKRIGGKTPKFRTGLRIKQTESDTYAIFH